MPLFGSLRNLVPSRSSTPKAWGAEFVTAQRQLAAEGSLVDLLTRATGGVGRPRRAWRRVSVGEALGVPAINRAVTLIASTTGMLSMEAYRNGVRMDEPPRLIQRPNPYETPRTFYTSTAASFAKFGEFCWWIAHVDGDGIADALINVPLYELQVEENPANRLMPSYRWGSITGTRYSGANPNGRFVHEKYPLTEPFALRGDGPLQLCGAANSVSVESQTWAANFYGEGGHPSTVIKKAGSLSPTKLDPTTWLPMDPTADDYNSTGRSEADLLRDQVIGRANNTAMVIDDQIESIEFKQPNTVGAQMLDARQFNNGDAAREFGIPGSLLEYQQPGSSLTYQNLEGEFSKFLKVCLQPIYLETIEQAMSDLLTRSTTSRFNTRGFLRPDAKSRWEIYQLAVAVLGQVDAATMAREQEGMAPGDIEFAPVAFAPPAAIPASIPRQASMRDVRCPNCKRLVTRSDGVVEGRCGHCKLTFTDKAA